MLKSLQWLLWLPAAWYNKGCIHRLANPRKRCVSIVVSMSVYLSLSPREYVRNYMFDLYQMFGACCLRSWLDLHSPKGPKSTIYDCLIIIIIIIIIVVVVVIIIIKQYSASHILKQTCLIKNGILFLRTTLFL